MQSTAGHTCRAVLRSINHLSPHTELQSVLLESHSGAMLRDGHVHQVEEKSLPWRSPWAAQESFANIYTRELAICTTKMDFFTSSLIPHSSQLLLPLVTTSYHLSYPELTSSTLSIMSHQHKQFPSPLEFISRRKHIKSNLSLTSPSQNPF